MITTALGLCIFVLMYCGISFILAWRLPYWAQVISYRLRPEHVMLGLHCTQKVVYSPGVSTATYLGRDNEGRDEWTFYN